LWRLCCPTLHAFCSDLPERLCCLCRHLIFVLTVYAERAQDGELLR
jgi:hypothetical protein